MYDTPNSGDFISCEVKLFWGLTITILFYSILLFYSIHYLGRLLFKYMHSSSSYIEYPKQNTYIHQVVVEWNVRLHFLRTRDTT